MGVHNYVIVSIHVNLLGEEIQDLGDSKIAI